MGRMVSGSLLGRTFCSNLRCKRLIDGITTPASRRRINASILLGLAAPLAYGQKATINPPQKTLEATVCEIRDHPSAYNNRVVRVRGYVSASSEYSLLVDERCDTNPLWLAFADGLFAPQLVATINGTGTAGGRDSKGRQIPPMPVHLIRRY